MRGVLLLAVLGLSSLAACAQRHAVAPQLPTPEPAYVPLPGEQYSPGAAGALDALHTRALARLSDFQASLPAGADTPWKDLREPFVALLEDLARDAYHDGALGPGTAAVDAEVTLEPLRQFLDYGSWEGTCAADALATLGLEARPALWDSDTPELPEHRLPLEGDVEKWLVRALPRAVVNGDLCRAWGPASLRSAIRTASGLDAP